MDPATLALGGIGAIAGPIAGAIQQQQAYAAQQAAIQQILDMYKGISLPQLQAIAPQLLGPSAAGAVTTDPALQAAQMSALSGLQQEAQKNGMTSADQAALDLAENKVSGNEEAQRAAIGNLLASRGLGSSGAAIAEMGSGARNNADAAATAGEQAATAARSRALQAFTQGGQLAGNISNEQFNQRMQTASARDAWNKYNTDAMNKAQYYNAALPEERFQNQMTLTGAQTQPLEQMGQSQLAGGQANAGFTGTLGNSLGQTAAAFAKQFGNKQPGVNYGNTNTSNSLNPTIPDSSIDWGYGQGY